MAGKHSSSLVEMKRVGNLVESMNMESRICVSENASNSRKKTVEASDASLPDVVSSPSSKKSGHYRPPVDGSEGYRKRSRNSERRKSELPLRSSKRLAGIDVDALLRLPREPKTRRATRLAGIIVDSSSLSLPEPRKRQPARVSGLKTVASPSPAEPKTHQVTQEAGIEVDASASLPREPKIDQATRKFGIKVDASPPEPKTRQAQRQAGIEIDASRSSLPEPKTRQAARLVGIRVDASQRSSPEPKTRQARRLAGMVTLASLNSLPEPKTRKATARRVREAEARTTFDLVKTENSTFHEMQVESVEEIPPKHDRNVGKTEHRKESSILFPPVGHQESHDNKTSGIEFKAGEKQELQTITPPAIKIGPAVLLPVSYTTAEEQAPPTAVTPPVSNPIPQDSYGGGDMKPESSTNFSMNDLWTDPCIEFAVKTLTGEIPFGELNKANNFPPPPLEVPLEELWTDPCIEFAVKTLTGAIPVGEDPGTSDTLDIRSVSLPDVGRNFCQTEVLSKHYETGNHKRQDPAAPTVGNGGLQMAGDGSNVVVSQGINCQCSRPRWFQ